MASLGAFALAIVAFVIVMATYAKGGPGRGLATFGNFTFVLSCAATSFASLAFFSRFATKSNRVADSLAANAYGIYLLHYACVSWLQLALLDTPLSGAGKGSLVFLGALLVSWALSALLGRIPVVGRILGNGSPHRATEARVAAVVEASMPS
jgi:peptidoglycan/LPS O-acetylase OafA/YrhL